MPAAPKSRRTPAPLLIGIDIGGTKIAGGLVLDGRVVRKLTLATPQSKREAIKLLDEMIAWLSQGQPVGRIGIGVPGLYRGTKITYLPHIPALHGVDLKRTLKAHAPIVLENDARCFTLAEAAFGAAKGKRNVVGLIIGTGVGSGILIDGQLYHGAGGAGEIGHVRFPDLTSVEQHLSGPSIVARHTARGGTEDHPAKIWAAPSKAARDTRAEAEAMFALTVANLISIFDPDVIVVGGGVSHQPLVASLASTLPGCKTTVRQGALGDNAGILGAALAAKQ